MTTETVEIVLPIRVELLEDWPDKDTATVTVEDGQTAVVRMHRNANADLLLPFNRQVTDDVMNQIARETE